jgi:hypothetical protein
MILLPPNHNLNTMPRAKTNAEWKELVPSGVAQNWSSPNPAHNLNLHGNNSANLKHPSNLIDHGFNHLDLPTSIIPKAHDVPHFQEPIFTDCDDERQYLHIVAEKLKMAKLFILKEVELGLNPNRRMDKDSTAVELTRGPIVFTNYTQELIRDLVTLRIKLEELGEGGDEKEVQTAAAQYQWAWKEMRVTLLSLLPGDGVQVKYDRAEEMMFEVLGKMFNEVQEGEDGV